MQCQIYGLRVRVSGDWPEVVEALTRDFAWFPRASGPAEVNVCIRRRRPDLSRFGPLEASRITWRSAEFRDGGTVIVDYLGRAVTVDGGAGTLTVEGEDGWYVWRASYEYLMERAGEHLDRVGLTRVNGLGLAGPRGGMLVILESGGGKTTLALRALSDGARLVSEGSPLLDTAGRLHPFPVPLLVRSTSPDAASLPEEHLRRLPGIDPDPLSLEVSAFIGSISTRPVRLRDVVFCVRSLRAKPSLNRIPWRRTAIPMARATVGGHGLLRGGPVVEAPCRLWAARRRAAAFASAVLGAQAWRLQLGLDKDANWNVLAELLGN